MTTHNQPGPAPGPEISAGTDLTPFHQAALTGEGSLLERVSALIERARAAVATQAEARALGQRVAADLQAGGARP